MYTSENYCRKITVVIFPLAMRASFKTFWGRKQWVITGLITLVVSCLAFFPGRDRGRFIQVDLFFANRLNEVQKEVKLLRSLAKNKSSLNILKKRFLQVRLAYKRLSVLSEYFNPYESKYLNGPAISRTEDDVPDVIIPAHGLQAIESLLFAPPGSPNYELIADESAFVLTLLDRMETETDRIYKFRDELVWDALRSACARIAILDIVGFDSPTALYSLDEASATLQGIRQLAKIYEPDVPKNLLPLFAKLSRDISAAQQMLKAQRSFNQFDRVNFITSFSNPIYRSIVQLRKGMNIPKPGDNYPTNADAENIFAHDFFNIDFFSPPKEYRVTEERILLGKKLFYDPILSSTNTRSCGSCHKPELAFTDGLKTPLALDSSYSLRRNTPTLWNSAFQTRQFYDSRTTVLEDQLDEVVHNDSEMRGSLKLNAEALKNNEEYRKLFTAAYADEKDPFAPFNIANAISSYVRSLAAFNSRFDQYMNGNKTALTISERNGFNLFAGKGKCATCHFIPLFNGLVPPRFTETESEVLGVPESAAPNSKVDPDKGKFEFTTSPVHEYAFKTPTLRNITLTAPYMHNGVYNTLNEVMDFYNNGGGAGLRIQLENQTLPPEKLNLTRKEIADIIAFMGTLTDTVAIHPRR